MKRLLLDLHASFTAAMAEPRRWLATRSGTDLFADGFDTLSRVSRDELARAADAFLVHCRANGGIPELATSNLADVLARFDGFLASRPRRPKARRTAIALGLCLLEACGRLPYTIDRDCVIQNDAIATLLSPTYRFVRFAGYNEGVEGAVHSDPAMSRYFRPDSWLWVVGEPMYKVVDGIPRLPFYTSNHETAHIVLFGDSYVRRIGDDATALAAKLNAEETTVALDLALMAELMAGGIELHSMTLLAHLGDPRRGMDPRVFHRLFSRSRQRRVVSEQVLKARVQRIYARHGSYAPSPLHDRLKRGANRAGYPLARWLQTGALDMHVRDGGPLFERLLEPELQRFVGLIPPRADQTANLLTATELCWEDLKARFRAPNPDSAQRELAVRRRNVRIAITRLGELSAKSQVRLRAGLWDSATRLAVQLSRSLVDPGFRLPAAAELWSGSARTLPAQQRDQLRDSVNRPLTIWGQA
jgi:hypothetical protein